MKRLNLTSPACDSRRVIERAQLFYLASPPALPLLVFLTRSHVGGTFLTPPPPSRLPSDGLPGSGARGCTTSTQLMPGRGDPRWDGRRGRATSSSFSTSSTTAPTPTRQEQGPQEQGPQEQGPWTVPAAQNILVCCCGVGSDRVAGVRGVQGKNRDPGRCRPRTLQGPGGVGGGVDGGVGGRRVCRTVRTRDALCTLAAVVTGVVHHEKRGGVVPAAGVGAKRGRAAHWTVTPQTLHGRELE